MADIIYVNPERAGEEAKQIESAASYLGKVSLTPQDMRTSLPANTNGKSAYGRAQDRISRLGVLLDWEAQNIRRLGGVFAEFDEMMGRLGENGFRHPVITAKE